MGRRKTHSIAKSNTDATLTSILGSQNPRLTARGLYFSLWRCGPTQAMASSFLRFLDYSRHKTVGRTLLDKWSARRRGLCLTTHNTHNRQTSMPPAGFEPTIPAGERPQTHALDRAVYMIGSYLMLNTNRLLCLLRGTFVFHTYHFAESQDRVGNTIHVSRVHA
jgi:hypothetical protein